MSDTKLALVAIGGFIAMVVMMVFITAHVVDERKKDCERRGGVYWQTFGGHACLSKDAVISR